MNETVVITNARIVTRDNVFDGSVCIKSGRIEAVDEGRSRCGGTLDLESDYLLPGLVELHTDNLEKHLMPRPKVRWPELPALPAHDAEIAAAGITTIFDALGVGRHGREGAARTAHARRARFAGCEAIGASLLRADHHVHVRCELAAAFRYYAVAIEESPRSQRGFFQAYVFSDAGS